MPPVSSHEVFKCLLTRRIDKRETNSGTSFHIHCQGGQCAHRGRGVGGEHVKYWSCTELGLCSLLLPPGRRGYHRGPYRTVSYRIVSCRFFRGTLSNCIPSPSTAMWSVPTIMARIHCVDVPVKSGRENTEMACHTPQVAVRSSTSFSRR